MHGNGKWQQGLGRKHLLQEKMEFRNSKFIFYHVGRNKCTIFRLQKIEYAHYNLQILNSKIICIWQVKKNENELLKMT